MSVYSFKFRTSQFPPIDLEILQRGLNSEEVDRDDYYVWVDVTGPDEKVAEWWARVRANRATIFAEFLDRIDEAPDMSKDSNYRRAGEFMQAARSRV